ncbi:MAG: hypothetical protein Tsb0021_06040 [Chlamydiales bacterium]
MQNKIHDNNSVQVFFYKREPISNINDLPREILKHIFHMLSSKTWKQTVLTSKDWKTLTLEIAKEQKNIKLNHLAKALLLPQKFEIQNGEAKSLSMISVLYRLLQSQIFNESIEIFAPVCQKLTSEKRIISEKQANGNFVDSRTLDSFIAEKMDLVVRYLSSLSHRDFQHLQSANQLKLRLIKLYQSTQMPQTEEREIWRDSRWRAQELSEKGLWKDACELMEQPFFSEEPQHLLTLISTLCHQGRYAEALLACQNNKKNPFKIAIFKYLAIKTIEKGGLGWALEKLSNHDSVCHFVYEAFCFFLKQERSQEITYLLDKVSEDNLLTVLPLIDLKSENIQLLKKHLGNTLTKKFTLKAELLQSSQQEEINDSNFIERQTLTMVVREHLKNDGLENTLLWMNAFTSLDFKLNILKQILTLNPENLNTAKSLVKTMSLEQELLEMIDIWEVKSFYYENELALAFEEAKKEENPYKFLIQILINEKVLTAILDPIKNKEEIEKFSIWSKEIAKIATSNKKEESYINGLTSISYKFPILLRELLSSLFIISFQEQRLHHVFESLNPIIPSDLIKISIQMALEELTNYKDAIKFTKQIPNNYGLRFHQNNLKMIAVKKGETKALALAAKELYLQNENKDLKEFFKFCLSLAEAEANFKEQYINYLKVFRTILDDHKELKSLMNHIEADSSDYSFADALLKPFAEDHQLDKFYQNIATHLILEENLKDAYSAVKNIKNPMGQKSMLKILLVEHVRLEKFDIGSILDDYKDQAYFNEIISFLIEECARYAREDKVEEYLTYILDKNEEYYSLVHFTNNTIKTRKKLQELLENSRDLQKKADETADRGYHSIAVDIIQKVGKAEALFFIKKRALIALEKKEMHVFIHYLHCIEDVQEKQKILDCSGFSNWIGL